MKWKIRPFSFIAGWLILTLSETKVETVTIHSDPKLLLSVLIAAIFGACSIEVMF